MRQETVTYTYYTFDELTDDQKKKAIDKHREINVDYDWYDHTISDFKEVLEILGFKKVDISFSGFWSQGDGASFTGEFLIPSDDDTLEMRVKKLESEYTWHYEGNEKLFKRYSEMSFKDDESLYLETYEVYRISHHYCHSNTITCDHDELKEFVRSFSDFIYKTLEKEYDHLTSDEVVKETLISNEIEFRSDEL